MNNVIDEVRDMITSFKLGILKTPELCDEIITKAKEYLVSEQKYKEYLDFSARFYKYSFNNTIVSYIGFSALFGLCGL